MYTMYRNYKQLIKDLKRRKVIRIHDDVMAIAEKVATCRFVHMTNELVEGTKVTMLRYVRWDKPVIGYAISETGVRLPVVGFRHVTGGERFYLVQDMHGVRGVLESEYRFLVKKSDDSELAYAA